MAGASLLALIDDIATVLDDVALLTKVAAKKTAGVLGDDLALNAQQVVGVRAERELPVVWAVAVGSFRNKLILVPAALAISRFMPAAVTPLLMLGGLYLCFEGVEKLAHRWLHGGTDGAAEHAGKLAALTDYERQITVNVGTMRGGVVTNRVPHEAESWLEMRTFKPDTYQETIDEILALNGQSDVASSVDGYACSVNVNLYRKTPPWARNEATDRLFNIWQETGESLGFTILPEERGGLSDGNHFWQRVPSLDGLGPSGANAHCSERSEDGSKDQEYVMVSSFVPKATLNTMAVLNLIGAFDE